VLSAKSVVATLAYLAMQIRQNTVAMRVSAKHEITRQFPDHADLPLKNPDLFDLNRRGQLGKDPDATENALYGILLAKATWHFASMYFQHEMQSLFIEEWKQSSELISRYCGRAEYRKWWLKNRCDYAPSFVR